MTAFADVPRKSTCCELSLEERRVLTRRDVLVGTGLAAVCAAFAGPVATAFATASQPGTPVNFDVPDGAGDCHSHIFGDPQKFPFATPRRYTPEIASVDEMRALHRTLRTPRTVIVATSVYGTDGRCTIDAVKQLGPNARGVIAIADDTTNEQLDELPRGGICGIRVDLDSVFSAFEPELARHRMQAAIERLKGRPLHIELSARLPVIEAVKDQV